MANKILTISFHHGALCDPYEMQANDQGFTFGDKAGFVQELGDGLIAARIHGCITDKELDKIIDRFQAKILIKNLKKMGAEK